MRSRLPAGVKAIVAYKAFKGVLALGGAFAAFSLLSRAVAERLVRFADFALVHRHLPALSTQLAAGLPRHDVLLAAGGAMLFAALDFVEAAGLYLRRLWALWLTVVASAVYLPVEVFEVAHRRSLGSVLFLAGNVAVVAYLALRVRVERRHLSEVARTEGGRAEAALPVAPIVAD